jgi:GntP family gluconate:H+ symporter
VILTGLLISIPTTIICWLFASRFLNKTNTKEHEDEEEAISLSSLPALWKSLLPIIIPLLLIALGSATELVKMPERIKNGLVFFGSPLWRFYVVWCFLYYW